MSAVGIRSSSSGAVVSGSPSKSASRSKKEVPASNISSFEMPSARHEWFDKDHNLRYSIVFVAPGGVTPRELKHRISADGTELILEFTWPHKYACTEYLLAMLIEHGTRSQIYPRSSSRAVAMTEILKKLKCNKPNGGPYVMSPMFFPSLQAALCLCFKPGWT